MPQPSVLDRLRRWLSGRAAPGASRPAVDANAKSGAHGSGLRQQRAARREQLFAFVRENMIRMGVLSSHYKFKVLTLDPAGDQFIVMVDWQPGALATGPVFEQPFEAGLQHLLAERQQGFKVKAVYWRGHGDAASAAAQPPAAPPALQRHAPAGAAVGTPPSGAPHTSQRGTHHNASPRVASGAARSTHAVEQVAEDELKALQAALRQAGAAAQASQTVQATAPRTRSAELPDFEPTVNTEGQQGTEFGALSETQYGKLS